MIQNSDFLPEQVDIIEFIRETEGIPNEEYQITLKVEGDKLTVQHPDGDPISYIAIGSDVFMAPHGLPKPIHFLRDGKGNVNSLLSGSGGGLYQRRG